METFGEFEFIEFIKNFNVQNRPQILALLEKYADKNIVVFRSRQEADNFLINFK